MTIDLTKATSQVTQMIKKLPCAQGDTILPKVTSKSALTPLKADIFEKAATDVVQTAKQKVSLARNPVWKCDIPCKKDYFYRTIGDGGYQDFLETGKIRPKQNTKVNYKRAYFEKGHVNQIYAGKHGGGNYIVETNSPKIICNSVEYPHVDMLDKTSDCFRIWRRVGDIDGTPHYEIIYDGMR